MKCPIKLVESFGHFVVGYWVKLGVGCFKWGSERVEVGERNRRYEKKTNIDTTTYGERHSYLVRCHQAVQVSTSISAVVLRMNEWMNEWTN